MDLDADDSVSATPVNTTGCQPVLFTLPYGIPLPSRTASNSHLLRHTRSWRQCSCLQSALQLGLHKDSQSFCI